MNIFLCCLQSPLESHNFWRENFKRSLERMGHTVLEPVGLDLLEPLHRLHDRKWIARNRSANSQAFYDQVKLHHERCGVDLFFSYFWSFHIEPEAIKAIERLGIPTVNYFCDNLREFESVEPLVNAYTLNWVPEKRACELYEKRKAPHIYLPMSADPEFYKPSYGKELTQVTFIGSADYMRIALLGSLVNSEFQFRVYGRRWLPDAPNILATAAESTPPTSVQRLQLSARQHWHRLRNFGIAGEWRHFARRQKDQTPGDFFADVASPKVSHEHMVSLTSNSAIVLGVNRCPHPGYPSTAPLVYSRLRDVEAPMMGACYLTEYCDDLEELYEVGKEVAAYRDGEELISECRRLLSDSFLRSSLRDAGHKAATSRHTWAHRFNSLFVRLGLSSDKRSVA